MRRARSFVVLAGVVFGVEACSVLTSWDDVQLGLAKDASALDATREATIADASGDAATETRADACVPGSVICVDQSPTGTSAGPALYACNDAGSFDPPVACLHECVHPKAGNEYCSCEAGSTYCGGDNVVGDPLDLFKCEGNAPPALDQKCSVDCVVKPGADDKCNP